MGPTSHHKTQSLLLIQRLLSLRESASPLNVVVDSLEQSARPILGEYLRQAQVNQDVVIYVSFETLQAPRGTTHFVQARRKSVETIQQEVRTLIQNSHRSLVLVDSIQPLLEADSPFVALLPAFTAASSSLILVYHESLPTSGAVQTAGAYTPSPLTLLTYLATTIIHVHSLAQVKSKHEAQAMSRAAPLFGLDEDKDGIIFGQGANEGSEVVVDMEHRRKSGRSVCLSFVLSRASHVTGSRSNEPRITLRDDHPALTTRLGASSSNDSEFLNGTFNLELTDKQREARDGVVLPYFDAQTGGGQGGKILYEMDREDDFDEEEDEI